MAYPNLAHEKDNTTMMLIYLIHKAKEKEWLSLTLPKLIKLIIGLILWFGTFSDGMFSDRDV